MSPWTAVLGLIALLAVGVLAIYLVSLLLSPREVLDARPFLSGHDPREHALSRFHVRWYAVTLVFLAFDMEMVFMYPWALVAAEVGAVALVEMFAFLGLLMVGVVYAWREGALRWS
ncbi:NADH ubiquinone oxidoreductase chain A [[Actinomadura] parvosata subsp. kistnae]|uniref:NADH-quinone oxidoreductase subunit n=1 Tax=[Actinomadura] parvosata subsp. kistnae TaxID=1909395 RepID=A0A1V0A007_9ACTN|nr:NADH-quinone oxidoreductase subunit A [Nonomuraea sp. ATCC 55076]AQZ63534.1 NADH dehydrogenase [Nonomuraea sp. ATCC 55076]SPL99289.1 NADH ubiquinone oxidoreductase chain A [Actinomadura parvosata subsp. kistnae]